jgi:spore coat protein CotH
MREPAQEGIKINESEVESVSGELYDLNVFRTIFIDFEMNDWEEELETFHGTDVDVVATITVDGKTYENVGIHFRGASSYMMVPRGSKRSFNLSFDIADKEQRLYGYKTLNLLNSNGDPSMLSSVLYSHISRQYMPAPKANMVRVVVNGENWGVFANVQQFNKEFLAENYSNTKGTRWKVSGSPQGRGGLEYFGEDENQYKRHFEMKSNDPKAWKHLINLCKVLNETPTDKLKEAIAPLIDLDEVLWFLALDNALINSDGYWVRASDYNLYLDENKVFHVIPHDMNEAFRAAGGPGMSGPGMGGPGGRGGFEMRGPVRQGPDGPEGQQPPPRGERFDRAERPNFQGRPGEGQPPLGQPGFGPPDGEFQGGPPRGGFGKGGPGSRAPDLDPLIGLDNPRMPLRSKLLAVPELREQYLKNVQTIARQSLTWEKLGPVIQELQTMLQPHVKADTKKLSSYEAFMAATSANRPNETTTANPVREQRRGDREGDRRTEPTRPAGQSLRDFIEGRQKFLLEYQPKD